MEKVSMPMLVQSVNVTKARSTALQNHAQNYNADSASMKDISMELAANLASRKPILIPSPTYAHSAGISPIHLTPASLVFA